MANTMYDKVFSDFEVKDSSIKFEDDEIATKMGCVGSFEEAMNSKTITKKCEGVVVKNVTRGDGTGELSVSLHMRYDLYLKTFGMLSDGLKDGVYGYGQTSVHKPFCLTCRVLDEDGVEKLKAYPNCTVSSGKAMKVENGAEEVAEGELTIAVAPDEYGYGVYEALTSLIAEETVKTDWLNNFTPDLVKETSA